MAATPRNKVFTGREDRNKNKVNVCEGEQTRTKWVRNNSKLLLCQTCSISHSDNSQKHILCNTETSHNHLKWRNTYTMKLSSAWGNTCSVTTKTSISQPLTQCITTPDKLTHNVIADAILSLKNSFYLLLQSEFKAGAAGVSHWFPVDQQLWPEATSCAQFAADRFCLTS